MKDETTDGITVLGIIYYTGVIIGGIIVCFYNLIMGPILIIFGVIGLRYMKQKFDSFSDSEIGYWTCIAPIGWYITSIALWYIDSYGAYLPIWLISSFFWYVIPIVIILTVELRIIENYKNSRQIKKKEFLTANDPTINLALNEFKLLTNDVKSVLIKLIPKKINKLNENGLKRCNKVIKLELNRLNDITSNNQTKVILQNKIKQIDKQINQLRQLKLIKKAQSSELLEALKYIIKNIYYQSISKLEDSIIYKIDIKDLIESNEFYNYLIKKFSKHKIGAIKGLEGITPEPFIEHELKVKKAIAKNRASEKKKEDGIDVNRDDKKQLKKTHIPYFCRRCRWFNNKDQTCQVDETSGEIYDDFNLNGEEECFEPRKIESIKKKKIHKSLSDINLYTWDKDLGSYIIRRDIIRDTIKNIKDEEEKRNIEITLNSIFMNIWKNSNFYYVYKDPSFPIEIFMLPHEEWEKIESALKYLFS